MQFARRFCHRYDRLTRTRPIVTKGLTTGAPLGAGDVLCQAVEQHVAERDGGAAAPPDGERTLRMFTWGLLCIGPAGHVWYQALDRAVPHSGKKALLAKIAADQLLYTPPLTLLYFVWQHALSRHTLGWSAVSDACDRGAHLGCTTAPPHHSSPAFGGRC